jgi:TonB family protein
MMRCMLSAFIVGILSLSGLVQSRGTVPSALLEKQLDSILRNKTITLSTFSKSARQHFDEDGQSIKQGDVGSWTIYSQVFVKKIDVSQNRIRIDGVRIIHHFDSNLKRLIASPSDMEIQIDVDTKRDATLDDASATLKKILVGTDGLVPLVPPYWRSYLGAKKDEPPTSDNLKIERVRVGGSVMGLKIIKQVRPTYSEVAKNFLLQGVVVLEAEINETGDVANISIIQPAGAGFDESAVDAVSQWKYKPTTLNGNPVKVVTTITVNYAFSR